MNEFEDILNDLKDAGLFRTLRCVEPLPGGRLRIDGRQVLNFAGNDYLGLRLHPDVIDAACRCARQYGAGAGASRLLAGTTPAHAEFERRLADFVGAERALVFSTGYQANVGALSALATSDDVIILDALCHASLVDGAKQSAATMRVYPHAACAQLEELLNRYASAKRRFIVTEGVFSMDGDLAPLAEVVALVEKYDAWLVLDDAHAFGVLGSDGRGTASELGITLPRRTLFIGTLSKAAGSQGGFVASTVGAVEVLVNRARGFIYTTALAPSAVGAALKALDLFGDTVRRGHLRGLGVRARQVLQRHVAAVPDGVTPIIPVVLGDVERALKVSARLFEEGIFAPAIRPPTVRRGTARLRISLSAEHTAADVDHLSDCLGLALTV